MDIIRPDVFPMDRRQLSSALIPMNPTDACRSDALLTQCDTACLRAGGFRRSYRPGCNPKQRHAEHRRQWQHDRWRRPPSSSGATPFLATTGWLRPVGDPAGPGSASPAPIKSKPPWVRPVQRVRRKEGGALRRRLIALPHPCERLRIRLGDDAAIGVFAPLGVDELVVITLRFEHGSHAKIGDHPVVKTG